MCARWVAKDPSFLRADSEDSDQTGRMPRLVCVFADRTGYFVGFVVRLLSYTFVVLALIPRQQYFDMCKNLNCVSSYTCKICHKC